MYTEGSQFMWCIKHLFPLSEAEKLVPCLEVSHSGARNDGTIWTAQEM